MKKNREGHQRAQFYAFERRMYNQAAVMAQAEIDNRKSMERKRREHEFDDAVRTKATKHRRTNVGSRLPVCDVDDISMFGSNLFDENPTIGATTTRMYKLMILMHP